MIVVFVVIVAVACVFIVLLCCGTYDTNVEKEVQEERSCSGKSDTDRFCEPNGLEFDNDQSGNSKVNEVCKNDIFDASNISERDDSDEITAVDIKKPRMQVLGACSRRGNGSQADILLKGTVLYLKESNDTVFVCKKSGKTIGMLHPSMIAKCREAFANYGLNRVVVVDDVNLNDKYGQCFVHCL